MRIIKHGGAMTDKYYHGHHHDYDYKEDTALMYLMSEEGYGVDTPLPRMSREVKTAFWTRIASLLEAITKKPRKPTALEKHYKDLLNLHKTAMKFKEEREKREEVTKQKTIKKIVDAIIHKMVKQHHQIP